METFLLIITLQVKRSHFILRFLKSCNKPLLFISKVPDYQQAVSYPTGITEIPVAAVIEGYIQDNPNQIKHEYNFYEFRPFVERKTDLYVVSFFN